MRSGTELDRLAESATGRYAKLLLNFELLLANALAGRDWHSARARAALRKASYGVAGDWLDTERSLIQEIVAETGEIAARDVDEATGAASSELPDEIQRHLEAISQDLEHNLRLQIERDTSLLVGLLRDAALRRALRGRGASLRASRSLGALRDETLSGVVFTVPDRAGRKWASHKLVRTLWRQALVLAGTETALLRMVETRLDLAEVIHPDRAHEGSGRRVALVDGAPGEPWMTVREVIFHPNTHAQLVPVLESD
jgi:hypothetical protein